VLLLGSDQTNSSQIVSSSNHDKVSNVVFDKVEDLSGLEIDLDGIINLDKRIRVSDGSSIMEIDVGNTIVSNLGGFDLAKLVFGLLGRDLLNDKSSLNVEQKSVVSVSDLIDGNNIHESSREFGISSNLAIDFDQSLLEDGKNLSLGESESQSVSQEDDKRQTLSGLVGSSRGFGSKNSRQLVEHPVLGSCESFQMLLGSTRHFMLQ